MYNENLLNNKIDICKTIISERHLMYDIMETQSYRILCTGKQLPLRNLKHGIIWGITSTILKCTFLLLLLFL